MMLALRSRVRASTLLATALITLPLLTASTASADSPPPPPPSCGLAIGSSARPLHVPANAPFIPLLDTSVGVAVEEVVAMPLHTIALAVDPPKPFDDTSAFIALVPAAPLEEGEPTLTVDFTCPIDGRRVELSRTVDVTAAIDPPKGSLGTITLLPSGHAFRVDLSPSSVAYEDLSSFEVEYSTETGSLERLFPHGPLGQSGTAAVVAGFGDDALDGATSLRTDVIEAQEACTSRTGTATLVVMITQHVAGTDATASATQSVTLDCTKLPEVPSETRVGCSVAPFPRSLAPDGAGAALLLGLAAVVLRRACSRRRGWEE